MASRPTMHDVAAEAGVSQAVVSLVLSGRYAGRASESTADRVREAAASTGLCEYRYPLCWGYNYWVWPAQEGPGHTTGDLSMKMAAHTSPLAAQDPEVT